MFFFRLTGMVAFIFGFIYRQKKMNDGFVEAYLEEFNTAYPKPIDAGVIRKIKNYYCLGIPLTCAVYNKLYGLPLSAQERMNAVLAGIGTPLIDDFTDNKTLSHQHLEMLLLQPEAYLPKTAEEEAVKAILYDIIKNVPDQTAALKAFHHAVIAQQASEKQFQQGLDTGELLQLSLNKGAWSHVIFHYLLNTVPDEKVVAVLHHMGGLLQLSNDIFDVYKDYKDGISTMANTHPDYSLLEDYYLSECLVFCENARKLPLKKANIERFILFIALIMARGLVALQQYKALQIACGGGVLPYPTLGRSQLITDMEKPVNIWRTVLATHKIVNPG